MISSEQETGSGDEKGYSGLRALARLLNLRYGEVTELLERLPFGSVEGAAESEAVPEVWQRGIARRALEAYAARKRAVIRLARYGQL